MRSKHSRTLRLLDTSAVVWQLHGHTLQQAAVIDCVAGHAVTVPVFVRMEYLRGIILNLIEMWALIRESATIHDAFVDWSQKVAQERKLKVVLLTVPSWLAAHDDPESRPKTLRRLGDLILRLVWTFDETYPRPATDPLACVLGRVDIPKQSYDDDLLLDFYVRFKAIQEGVPNCRLCEFKEAQRRRLRRRRIDLSSQEAKKRHKSNEGFLRQAQALDDAHAVKDEAPRCRWCARLGDTIVALHAVRGVTVVTSDRTFIALGDLLGQPITILPSLAELKRRQTPAEPLSMQVDL